METEAIKTAILVLATVAGIIGIWFWIAWSRFNNHRWRYAVAPVVWLLHAVTYFIFRIFEPTWLTVDARANWKFAIVLHALISLAFGGAVMWQLTMTKIKREEQAAEILRTLRE